MAKLEIKEISKSFISDGEINHVLEDISFEIEEGEIVTLLGPSGCGKSTTLNIIAGFLEQDSGEVLLNGENVTGPGPDKGFLFQSYALFPWLTVEENIRFPMQQVDFTKEEADERTKELLELVRLTPYKDYYISQVSGGMKQRNALARALALEPEILLMDEPLGALDVEMRADLQDQLLEIFNALNLTVIIVTHDIEESVYMSDRVILLSTNRGEIIFNESIDLPHPRDKKSKEFEEYSDTLTELFVEASRRGLKAQRVKTDKIVEDKIIDNK